MTGPRVLHLLSQRPMLTGSGVTLAAIAEHASELGWRQSALVASPDDSRPDVAAIPSEDIQVLCFNHAPLDFPIPGMSDVMPYPTMRFRDLSELQVATYCDAWRGAIADSVERFKPDVIHSHHVWLMSSLCHEVTDVPVVTHCHGTGLRQARLCPHLAGRVTRGVAKNAHFLALHAQQEQDLIEALGVEATQVSVASAGYRESAFTHKSEGDDPKRIAYVGKLSNAKGVPQLLRALSTLPDYSLDLIGGGEGPEADAIRTQAASIGPRVRVHGRVDQKTLTELLHGARVFVLPSYYEGLPLVLIEALASGCQLVSTALPGVVDQIAPRVPQELELVPLPRLVGPDTPHEDDIDSFVSDLASALTRASKKPRANAQLDEFRWRAVTERIEKVWRRLA